MNIDFKKNMIPISLLIAIFVSWAIWGEEFWMILTFLAFMIMGYGAALAPKSDKRYKTGYKDNATSSLSDNILLKGFISWAVLYVIGVFVYDWTLVQFFICRVITIGMGDCSL